MPAPNAPARSAPGKWRSNRCRDCPKRRMFSLKTGTVMQGSPLGYRTWLGRATWSRRRQGGFVVKPSLPAAAHRSAAVRRGPPLPRSRRRRKLRRRQGSTDEQGERGRGRGHGRLDAPELRRGPGHRRRQGLHRRARVLARVDLPRSRERQPLEGRVCRGDAGTQGIESGRCSPHTGTFTRSARSTWIM